MKTRFLLPLLVLATLAAGLASDGKLYELRTYYTNPGKLDALNARFRDHTVKLFEKHGITNVGYWTDNAAPDGKLVYLLSYPNREARAASWKAFQADPDWQKARAESEKGGKILAKIESVYLTTTDYSPAFDTKSAATPRLFELRHYTTMPGKLPDIHARFKNHTIELFKKHGMTNLVYFDVVEGPQKDNVLIYLLAHKDQASHDASFEAFRADPVWVAARDASEKAGPILIEKGVVSTILTPVDYSPLK